MAECVYLLRSTSSARTYVGYSRDPPRRLRQHNGEMRGGDAPVAGRPWALVMMVCGFRSKHAALTFESAWQRPHTSRHVSRVWNAMRLGTCSGRTSVPVRLQALCLLLQHGYWARDALDVHVLITRAAWHSHLERVRTLAPMHGWPAPHHSQRSVRQKAPPCVIDVDSD